MAIFLKKFETVNQYNAYTADTANFILPNVSLTVDNNTVHYNPSTPPTPSHDYVEIGGIKWATMNVGATGITDGGLHFEWGGTEGYTAAQVGEGEGQKYFGEEDNIFYGTYGYTKYTGDIDSGGDGLTTLQAADDAVTTAWGGNWRMPTRGEYELLLENVTTAWTTDYQGSGVSGLVCTDNVDNSKVLFFPNAGGFSNGNASYYEGEYWSSSLNDEGERYSDKFTFSNGYAGCGGTDRYGGCSVRGVLDE